jgi:hypothetical protein
VYEDAFFDYGAVTFQPCRFCFQDGDVVNDPPNLVGVHVAHFDF